MTPFAVVDNFTWVFIAVPPFLALLVLVVLGLLLWSWLRHR